jgi:hypothetical protein
MAGLVPAIPIDMAQSRIKDRDSRDTSAFTRVCDALCPAMTWNPGSFEQNIVAGPGTIPR